jgi:ribosome modulation factor
MSTPRLFPPPTRNKAFRAAYVRGWDAYFALVALDACPYMGATGYACAFRNYWCDGWRAARSTHEEERKRVLALMKGK